MRVICFAFFVCFLHGLAYSTSASAQGHGVYCDKADSTASTVKCLKRHLENAQKRLNLVFGQLTNDLEGEKLVELKTLQKTWLDYRDSECMWEAQRSEVKSLKHINELSCMARVTEDRADLLTIALSGAHDSSGQREFGSFPRWMNVAAKDYPDTYWNYGHRKSADLNCDGQDEFIMWGIQTNAIKQSDQQKDSGLYQKIITLAIAETPPIGRPKVTKFDFDIINSDKTGNINTLCSDDVSLAFIEEISNIGLPTDDKSNDKNESCTKLKISVPQCTDKYITWSGKSFELQEEQQELVNTVQK